MGDVDTRTEYVRLLYRRMGRFFRGHDVPVDYPLDTWYYRTSGEATYGLTLMSIMAFIAGWKGVHYPRQEALVLGQQLRAEFRFLHRPSYSPSFFKMLKRERRSRSRF